MTVADLSMMSNEQLVETLHKALQTARPFLAAEIERVDADGAWGKRAQAALTKMDQAMLAADFSTGRDFYS